jgi:hypothetical protein
MHTDDDDGDLGDVAMPGFIDILSSVITVFMFFMLITSAVMFFMSMAMKSHTQEETRKETQNHMSEEAQALVKRVQAGEISMKDMMARLEDMKHDNPTAPAVATPATTSDPDPVTSPPPEDTQAIAQDARVTFSKSTAQTTATGNDLHDMTIVFTDRGISVTDDTAKSLSAFLAQLKAANGNKPISVELDVPDNPSAPTLSISREVALGRTLNVRNILLQNKLKAGDISIHTVPPETFKDGYDWVRVHVRS